jgi:hypothetical protein
MTAAREDDKDEDRMLQGGRGTGLTLKQLGIRLKAETGRNNV